MDTYPKRHTIDYFLMSLLMMKLKSYIFRCRCTMFKKSIEEIEKSIEDLKHSNLIISAKTEYQFSEENEDIKRLNKKGSYFNAGVMIINFDLWKRKQIDQKLIEHMKLIENDIKYWDQDVLNSYFDEKYFSMNQYLNFNISTDKELVFKNPSEIENIIFCIFLET